MCNTLDSISKSAMSGHPQPLEGVSDVTAALADGRLSCAFTGDLKVKLPFSAPDNNQVLIILIKTTLTLNRHTLRKTN